MRRLTITKEDLTKAIEATTGPKARVYPANCVVACAARREWKRRVNVLSNGAVIMEKQDDELFHANEYRSSDPLLTDIIGLFDSEQYRSVETLLPVTFTLELHQR